MSKEQNQNRPWFLPPERILQSIIALNLSKKWNGLEGAGPIAGLTDIKTGDFLAGHVEVIDFDPTTMEVTIRVKDVPLDREWIHKFKICVFTVDHGKEIDNPKMSLKTANTIIKMTADHFSILQDHIKGKSKKKIYAHARQVAMYLVRKMTEMSYPDIGNIFGGRDHTTIMYGCEKIGKQSLCNEYLRITLTDIEVKVITYLKTERKGK